MDRRQFMAATAAGAAAFMASGAANAQEAARATEMPPLARTSARCVTSGEACLAHCLGLFAVGDTTLAACAQSVNQLIVACRALQALALSNSHYVPAFARATLTVCEDCEKECRKHENKHEICKVCANACKDCAAECKKAAAA